MSIPNYLRALANHEGPATVNAGGMAIPVKIMDIERTSGICESDETTFKCLVVNEDQIQYGSPDPYRTKIEALKKAMNQVYGTAAMSRTITPYGSHHMMIDRVIFNNPATIVIWADGTKTVVKCQEGDVYSKETGLALCIAKKALGNKGNFNNVFHEWIPEEEEEVECPPVTIQADLAPIGEAAANLADNISKVFGRRRRCF